MAPELWLFAGPNGAGKTSFLNASNPLSRLAGSPLPLMLNPDVYTLKYLQERGLVWHNAPPALLKEAFTISARRVEEEAFVAVRAGRRIALETVLSTSKYLHLVQEILKLGGQFHFFYVALRSPTLSAERVALRVAKGGHQVPADRLIPRWQKSLANLPIFAALASSFYVLDNSEFGNNPSLIAYGGRGALQKSDCHLLEPNTFPEMLQALQPLVAKPQS